LTSRGFWKSEGKMSEISNIFVHALLAWSSVSYQKIFFFTKHFNKTLYSFWKLFSKSLHYSCSKSVQRKVAIIFRKWFFAIKQLLFLQSSTPAWVQFWIDCEVESCQKKLCWSFRLCREVHWYKKLAKFWNIDSKNKFEIFFGSQLLEKVQQVSFFIRFWISFRGLRLRLLASKLSQMLRNWFLSNGKDI
jgi:hypothetical protein